nr:glycosyltransferase family 2 protein [uncultured Pedobacter sp.]
MDKSNWPYKVNLDEQRFSEHINWPKISVITPSYNQGAYIEETILSVLNQGYPNLEYIIIDGGSSDDTVNIIKRYATHLNYWTSEKDFGQTDAINKGFEKATGTIFSYLNSDDCYYEGALQKIAEAYLAKADPREDFLFVGNCYWAKDFSDDTGWLDIPNFPNNLKQALIQRGLSPQPSMFWTMVNQKLKFYNQLQFCMDFEFWLQLILHNYKVVKVDFLIALFRRHNLSKTSNLNHILEQELNGLSIIYAKYLNTGDDRFEIRNQTLKLEQIACAKMLVESVANQSAYLKIKHIFYSNVPLYLKLKIFITTVLNINLLK